MPDTLPRADRVIEYSHRFGELHDSIVTDDRPDNDFHDKISNRDKLAYICKANGISPMNFHLDMPLPLEDWAMSDDVSRLKSGLYFADMRQQFYKSLLRANPELSKSPAWVRHADAEFWAIAFNFALNKKLTGKLIINAATYH